MKPVKKFRSPVRTSNSTRNVTRNEEDEGIRRDRRGDGDDSNGGNGGGGREEVKTLTLMWVEIKIWKMIVTNISYSYNEEKTFRRGNWVENHPF